MSKSVLFLHLYMVYERDPIVPIAKANAEKFGVETSKGMNYYTRPYKIPISLKYD